jgi:hypothetical protein
VEVKVRPTVQGKFVSAWLIPVSHELTLQVCEQDGSRF